MSSSSRRLSPWKDTGILYVCGQQKWQKDDRNGKSMGVVVSYISQDLGMLAGMFMTLSKIYIASVLMMLHELMLLYCISTAPFN
jgi:hypothetical protein